MENNQIRHTTPLCFSKLTESDLICFSELTQDEFIHRFKDVEALQGDTDILIDIFNQYNSNEQLRYDSYSFDDVLHWVYSSLGFA